LRHCIAMALAGTVVDQDQIKFPPQSLILVAGPSSSGKTYYVKKLILNADEVFQEPPKEILYFMQYNQPAYQDLKTSLGDKISFYDTFPEDYQNIFGWSTRSPDSPPLLVVLDDLFEVIIKRPDVLKLFTGIGHHLHITVILLSQFIFGDSTLYRQINKQLTHMLIFPSVRYRSGLKTLSSQVFGNAKFLSLVAEDIRKQDPFRPMLWDLKPQQKEYLRTRAGTLADQMPVFVYTPPEK